MTIDSSIPAACENFVATYFTLGEAVGTVKHIHGEGFAGLISEFAHPIGNFAFCFDHSDAACSELRAICKGNRHFAVYRFSPSDGPIPRSFSQAGFEISNSLSQLEFRVPAGDLDPSVCLFPMTSRSDREMIAEFMVKQFFLTQSAATAERIAGATSQASKLLLYAAWKPMEPKTYRTIVGGVMIHVTENQVGLYNLCVAEPLRGSGIGSAILRNICNMHQSSGLPVVLQCASSLEGWYVARGFRPTGFVELYSLGF